MKRPTTLSNAMAVVDGSFISGQMEETALRVLEEAMGATAWVRGPKQKEGGQREYVEVPDHALRIAAAVRVIEWRRGKPAAQLTITPPPGGASPQPRDFRSLMDAHPETMRAVLSAYLEHLGKAVPIDVTPPANGKERP